MDHAVHQDCGRKEKRKKGLLLQLQEGSGISNTCKSRLPKKYIKTTVNIGFFHIASRFLRVCDALGSHKQALFRNRRKLTQKKERLMDSYVNPCFLEPSFQVKHQILQLHSNLPTPITGGPVGQFYLSCFSRLHKHSA